MSESKEPTPDASQPNGENRAENAYDTPTWRAIKKGIAGGALVGFVVAKYLIDTQSVDTPVGSIYTGNVLLLFGVWVGLGAAVGAGIGWLSMRKIGDGDRPPPPDLARKS